MQEGNYSFNDIPSIIGEVLRQKNMKKKELAQALGVTPVVISNWLSGKYNPRPKTMKKLIDFLPAPIDSFYKKNMNQRDLPSELAHWKHRTLSAEKKLEDMKKNIQSIKIAVDTLVQMLNK